MQIILTSKVRINQTGNIHFLYLLYLNICISSGSVPGCGVSHRLPPVSGGQPCPLSSILHAQAPHSPASEYRASSCHSLKSLHLHSANIWNVLKIFKYCSNMSFIWFKLIHTLLTVYYCTVLCIICIHRHRSRRGSSDDGDGLSVLLAPYSPHSPLSAISHHHQCQMERGGSSV